MERKIYEQPRKNIPDPADLNAESLAEEIKVKVENALKENNTRSFTTMGSVETYPVIEIERKKLFYNLENDRTLIKCEEYEEEHNLKEFFSNKNAWNVKNQQEYHKIIHGFIPKEMDLVLDETKNQRDEIFITSRGIVANGNTRLACMREFTDIDTDVKFKHIKCCVIPEQHSDDWGYLRSLVDSMDNQAHFGAEYYWYTRARRFEKDCLAAGITDITLTDDNEIKATQIKNISNSMYYKSPSRAIERYEMFVLARDFVKEKYLEGKYSKLSDLNKLGALAGKQVFQTLNTGHKKLSGELNVQKVMKNIAFAAIASEASSEKGEKFTTASSHLLIQKLYRDNNIVSMMNKYGSVKNVPDAFGSGKANDDSKPKKTKTFKVKNKNSRNAIIEDIKTDLGTAMDNAAADAGEDIRNRAVKRVEDIAKRIELVESDSLRDDSNLDNMKNALDKAKNALASLETAVQSIIESRV